MNPQAGAVGVVMGGGDVAAAGVVMAGDDAITDRTIKMKEGRNIIGATPEKKVADRVLELSSASSVRLRMNCESERLGGRPLLHLRALA